MGRALKLLLDTNAFYLAFYADPRLSKRSISAIASADRVFVSLVCFWELAIKARAGKIRVDALLDEGPSFLSKDGFELLGIEYGHIRETLALPLHHRDPFDRLLIAQAKTEGLTIVSSDKTLDRYEVKRIW